MIKISVIVPVHNTEPFLKECLDSVINQTLQEIEIICINDGSTDNCFLILENFKEEDGRIIILNQENKGAGAARNSGLKIAQGEYLAILDSDDIYDITMLEKMYERAEEMQAEFVICLSTAFDNSTMKTWNIMWSALEIEKNVFSYKDILKRRQNFDFFSGWSWDKLFRKSFIEQYQLRFQEISHSNDGYFVIMAMYSAKRISILREPLVKHRVNRENSIETSHDKNPLCFYEMHRAIKDGLEKLGIFYAIKKRYIIWVLRHSLWVLSIIEKPASFIKIYSKIQDDIFQENSISNATFHFFDDALLYDEIKKIAEQSATEYLFNQRNSARKERDILQKERDLLQNECGHLHHSLDLLKKEQFRMRSDFICLQNEYDKLRQERYALLNSLSFRLGRMLTWLPRKVRNKIGLT